MGRKPGRVATRPNLDRINEPDGSRRATDNRPLTGDPTATRLLVVHLERGGTLESFLVKALRFLSPGMLRAGAAVMADPRAARALQRRLHAEGRHSAHTARGRVA